MQAAGVALVTLLAAGGVPNQSVSSETPVPDSVHRGYGIGGMLYLFGAGFRVLGMLSAHESDFDPERTGAGGLLVGAVFQVSGLALSADASHELGKIRARQGRDLRPRPALGWTLFGVGAAMVVASRVVPRACFSSPCAIATSEGAFQAGFAAAAGGLNLALFSRGFVRGRVGLAPSVGRRRLGLVVSGRF